MEKKSRYTEHDQSSIFSQKNSALPDDTVFYSIFPDISKTLNLTTLQNQILTTINPYTSDYIWQLQPFTLSSSDNDIPHLHGKLRFGDNLEDEWFVVFLLFQISRRFPTVSIRVYDTDGEFLLIEAAFHLPRWINPENSENRVFIRSGDLHIVPRKRVSDPRLVDSLSFLANSGGESRASDEVQVAVKNRIGEYPERARKNVHCVRVRVPVPVAQVLKHEPCLISLAIEGFYDRDIDTMKYAAKMERFLSRGSGEEMVLVTVKMSRAMYAQLVQQTFQPPRCYPLPATRSDVSKYIEAELGMKIACGFEMMYQLRRKEGLEGKGSAWEVFRESLEKSGHFEGLLPGSKEYRRLMESAKEDYKKSFSFTRASEMMSAPVRNIDDILDVPHSSEDFKGVDVPPSDSDSWLYDGEDELNSALLERQKEMELYDKKHKKKQEAREQQNTGPSTSKKTDDFDLCNIAKTIQEFVHKVSSYEGAEVPDNRNLEEVNFDVDQFMKDMESVLKRSKHEGATASGNFEEGSSSDMGLDESEDDSDIGESSEENEGGEDTFMGSYSDALNDELKTTTLKKSFVRANEQSHGDNKGVSNNTEDMDEDFTPVDIDVNLVKSLLDSFSSQQGLPGPASNLLGIMGVHLPQDTSKDK